MHVEAGELHHSMAGGLAVPVEEQVVPPSSMLIIDDTLETDASEMQLEPHEMLVIDALLALRQSADGWCGRADIYATGFGDDLPEEKRNRLSVEARARIASVTFDQPPRSILEDNGKERGGKKIRLVPDLRIIDARITADDTEDAPRLTGLDSGMASLLEEAAAIAEDEGVESSEQPDEAPGEQAVAVSDNPEKDPELFSGLAKTAQTLIYAEASSARRMLPTNRMYEAYKPLKVVTTRRARATKESRDEPEGSSRQSRANGFVPKSEDSIAMYLAEIGKYPLLTKEGEVYMAQTIEAGNAAREIMADPEYADLPSEQRAKLRRIAQRGARTETEFVESNLRLTVSIAKKYQASGMPLLDLIQEGNLGLMHAVEKFDWRKGFKFSTYATWWIKQSITRGIANTGRTIRLPVHAVDSLSRLSKARIRLEASLGRSPKLHELADELGMPIKKVVDILEYAADAISLNEPVNTTKDAAELGELVQDKGAEDPAQAALASTFPDAVERALANLGERERAVLRLRFGLEDDRPKSLQEVGSEFGVTRERIRQIEAKAMSKIRHPSAGGALRALAQD